MAFRSFSTSIFALKSLFLIVNPIQTWAAVGLGNIPSCSHLCFDQSSSQSSCSDNIINTSIFGKLSFYLVCLNFYHLIVDFDGPVQLRCDPDSLPGALRLMNTCKESFGITVESAKPQLGGQSSPLVLYLGAQPPLPNNSSFSTLTSTGFVSSSSGGVNVISPPAPVPARVPAQSTGYVPTTPPELAPSGSALAHSINESGVSAASPSTNAPSRVSNQTPGLAPPPAQATAQNSASLRYSSSLNKPVIMVAASSFAMLFV
ncbi:expressed protein [Phakopsora pachyrhizi]|uniref:Expressed protein n=1 Tax=Phakopsora pachyrhizi TaxID=170000 RepID=A0AAV0AV08_PHAPC|nr:expressed protein [Phakopsora pachyrhizi]